MAILYFSEGGGDNDKGCYWNKSPTMSTISFIEYHMPCTEQFICDQYWFPNIDSVNFCK